eukprot:gene6053-8334_t
MDRLSYVLNRYRGLISPLIRRQLTVSKFPIYEGLKIVSISLYQINLPLHEKSYKWSGGNSVDYFDSTVVQIETNDKNITGYGENTPLGPAYLPAYAQGTRCGIEMIAPSLIGCDPTQLNRINTIMDKALKGHPYVKSAIDMACWDILGKVANLSVCELLGGRYGDSFQLYRAISQDTPENMARNVEKYYFEDNYRIFQLKVGGCPHDDIFRIKAVRKFLDSVSIRNEKVGEHIPLICDANTGWKMHEAVQVVNAVKDLNVYIEQPCLTYTECLSVRKISSLPMILDECMDDIGVLTKIISDHAADAINLKISKVGGLTKARAIRDLAVQAGIPMNIEDTWGGDIVTSAIAHLAHSTPPELLLCSTDFNSYGPVCIAKTTANRINGRMAAPITPGLGVEPNFDVLGKPKIVINK